MEKTTKLKILMIVRYYWPHLGGNENQAKLLSEYLVQKYPIEIVVVSSLYDKSLKKEERHNNIRIVRLHHFTRKSKQTPRTSIGKIINKLKFLLEEYSFLFCLYKFLKKEVPKVDLLHVHQTSWLSLLPNYFGQKYKKPVLIKEATLNGFKFLRVLLLPKIFKYPVLKYAQFIAISKMINEDLIAQGANPNNIDLIPNATLIDKEDVPLSLFSNNKKILFVGNFSHGLIKGLDVLLQAMVYVKDEVFDAKLVIIGEGNEGQYKSFIKTNGLEHKVYFLGKQTNVLSIYKATNVFVLPSRSEGMSNSLIEAMKFGIPCVATRVSGVEDLIDDGENGFVVDCEDSITMAKRIITLLQDEALCKKFSIAAQKNIINNFNMKKIAQIYHDLYMNLVSK